MKIYFKAYDLPSLCVDSYKFFFPVGTIMDTYIHKQLFDLFLATKKMSTRYFTYIGKNMLLQCDQIEYPIFEAEDVFSLYFIYYMILTILKECLD